jgi:hypothetical protein
VQRPKTDRADSAANACSTDVRRGSDNSAMLRRQKIDHICRLVREGTYWVPTERLAPLLARILESMTHFTARN